MGLRDATRDVAASRSSRRLLIELLTRRRRLLLLLLWDDAAGRTRSKDGSAHETRTWSSCSVVIVHPRHSVLVVRLLLGQRWGGNTRWGVRSGVGSRRDVGNGRPSTCTRLRISGRVQCAGNLWRRRGLLLILRGRRTGSG